MASKTRSVFQPPRYSWVSGSNLLGGKRFLTLFRRFGDRVFDEMGRDRDIGTVLSKVRPGLVHPEEMPLTLEILLPRVKSLKLQF
jgi:hypothetical protein